MLSAQKHFLKDHDLGNVPSSILNRRDRSPAVTSTPPCFRCVTYAAPHPPLQTVVRILRFINDHRPASLPFPPPWNDELPNKNLLSLLHVTPSLLSLLHVTPVTPVTPAAIPRNTISSSSLLQNHYPHRADRLARRRAGLRHSSPSADDRELCLAVTAKPRRSHTGVWASSRHVGGSKERSYMIPLDPTSKLYFKVNFSLLLQNFKV